MINHLIQNKISEITSSEYWYMYLQLYWIFLLIGNMDGFIEEFCVDQLYFCKNVFWTCRVKLENLSCVYDYLHEKLINTTVSDKDSILLTTSYQFHL